MSGEARPLDTQSIGLTPGVSVTTGPLGQGFAHGVGMAIAERFLADHFNRPHHEIVDHFTYAIVSDGDMQEGVTSEAASLAATLRLGKLIYFYDSNDIQIEGSTRMAFRENVARRFDAYGWQVIGPMDGTDLPAIEESILKAQNEPEKPSLIICKTIIGHCTPEEGTAEVHGDPIPELDVRKAKMSCNWPTNGAFYIPDEVLAHMREAVARGEATERQWQQDLEAYGRDYPDLATRFRNQMAGKLPDGWDKELSSLVPPGTGPMATRDAGGKVLNSLVKRVHGLTGGSADLDRRARKHFWSGMAISAGKNIAVTTSTLVCGNMRWAPLLAECQYMAESYRTRLHSLCSRTTCALP